MLEASWATSEAGRKRKGGTVFRKATTASVTTDVAEEREDKDNPRVGRF
jgi:hypothetical protein